VKLERPAQAHFTDAPGWGDPEHRCQGRENHDTIACGAPLFARSIARPRSLGWGFLSLIDAIA